MILLRILASNKFICYNALQFNNMDGIEHINILNQAKIQPLVLYLDTRSA